MKNQMSGEKTKSLPCGNDGRVDAVLRRVTRVVPVDGGSIEVPNVAAWVCPTCDAVLAVSHAASGRVAAAVQRESTRSVQEVRVPLALEDLALGVNASFGTAGTGDPFTLPVHLGLRLLGNRAMPAPSWKRFDDEEKTGRARPSLHPDTRGRLEGLARAWSTDLSSVIRWLTVLAADAIVAGVRTQTREELIAAAAARDVVFAESKTTRVGPFAVYSREQPTPVNTSPVSPVGTAVAELSLDEVELAA